MVQEIIVALLFVLALGYVAKLLYSSFKPKSGAGCAKGCGSCSALDVKKLEEQIRRAQK